LQEWLKSRWLVQHQTSRQEIGELLGVVDRDLADAQAAEMLRLAQRLRADVSAWLRANHSPLL